MSVTSIKVNACYVDKKKRTLTITLRSFKVISDDTLSSCDPFNFLLVREGRTFSIFGLFAATCNKRANCLTRKQIYV